jgi:hypothetical protein
VHKETSSPNLWYKCDVIRCRCQSTVLVAMAVAGAAAGHMLGYLLAYSDVAERAAVLARSGHEYWGTAVHVAALSFLTALLGHFALAIRGGRGSASGPGSLRAVWLRLALVQCSLFMIVEVAERLSSAGREAWLEPALWLAIPVQVAVAAVAALLLDRTRAAATAVTRRVSRLPAPPGVVEVRPPATRGLSSQVVRGRAHIRAPPGALVS